MRIAIFSDIHSNLEALLTVRESMFNKNVDKFVCLGDIVGYGANPNECCSIIRDMVDIAVLGNHDAAVTGQMDYSYYYSAAREVLDWSKEMLDKTNLNWLSSLPYSQRLEMFNFSHGHPLCVEDFEYIFDIEQVKYLIPYFDLMPPVCFIGHSHLCKSFAFNYKHAIELTDDSFKIDLDYKYIITDSSVGQPRDYDNRTGYGLVDSSKMTFEYIRLEYPIDRAAQKIIDAGLAIDFARRLFLGS